jgi:hypothetical protein
MREQGNAQRPGVYVELALVYTALAFALLWPALRGSFVSDDIGYVAGNPWIHSLSVANLRAILDPSGPAAAHTANYAPVHLLLHALFWQLFANPLGAPRGERAVPRRRLDAARRSSRAPAFRSSRPRSVARHLLHGQRRAVAWVFQRGRRRAGARVGGAAARTRRPLAATAALRWRCSRRSGGRCGPGARGRALAERRRARSRRARCRARRLDRDPRARAAAEMLAFERLEPRRTRDAARAGDPRPRRVGVRGRYL